MLRFLSSLLLFSILNSCQDCICLPSDGLRLGMISFDSTEIDTIMIRRFDKGSNFTRPIDSSQWDRSKVVFRAQNDTFQMGAFVGGILLQSKFDFEIYFPGLSRTFRITEMNEPQLEGNCKGKVMCGNIIVSCKLDGNPIPINYDILYLKK